METDSLRDTRGTDSKGRRQDLGYQRTSERRIRFKASLIEHLGRVVADRVRAANALASFAGRVPRKPNARLEDVQAVLYIAFRNAWIAVKQQARRRIHVLAAAYSRVETGTGEVSTSIEDVVLG